MESSEHTLTRQFEYDFFPKIEVEELNKLLESVPKDTYATVSFENNKKSWLEGRTKGNVTVTVSWRDYGNTGVWKA